MIEYVFPWLFAGILARVIACMVVKKNFTLDDYLTGAILGAIQVFFTCIIVTLFAVDTSGKLYQRIKNVTVLGFGDD